MDTKYPSIEDFPEDSGHRKSAQEQLSGLASIERCWIDPSAGYGWVDPNGVASEMVGSRQPEIFSIAQELGAADHAGMFDAASFFQKHGADSPQGIALMMLAESLARAPDDRSRHELLFDILPRGQWNSDDAGADAVSVMARLASGFAEWAPGGSLGLGFKRLGEKAAAKSALAAIASFAGAFVAGETLADVRKLCSKPQLSSFDMLGEGACTEGEATVYFERYMSAIQEMPSNSSDPWLGHGISVKLSALDPLFDRRHAGRPLAGSRLADIAKACEAKNLLLTVDAEEAERLALSLGVIESTLAILKHGYEGFGWAIQANLRSCQAATAHALALARGAKRRLALRLVKGAYWDSETRKACAGGYANPAWPAKVYTDRAWLSSAEAMLREPYAYPMLASHNPHSCAAALVLGRRMGGSFEFQRLHGMGAGMHKALEAMGARSRVYAPIGATKELLPYLARRLLENGANTSILRTHSGAGFDPGFAYANPFHKAPGKLAPKWEDAYAGTRENSPGFPLWMKEREEEHVPLGRPVAPGIAGDGSIPEIRLASPADDSLATARVRAHSDEEAMQMLARAHAAHLLGQLDGATCHARLKTLGKVLRLRRAKILTAIVSETGKRMEDAIGEWREACDFAAFHAQEALRVRSPLRLPSLPGEENWTWNAPRGVALCIGPWNFPFAILLGQATAALAAGCPILAKGASASPLCAQILVDCLREAGFEASQAQALFASGARLDPIVRDPRVASVAFTGSTQAARTIGVALAGRIGPFARFIAETGGYNIMLVDETAQLDAACQDILESAFNMSGQRCSALRCAWIDERIFDPLMAKLQGALRARSLGDPTRDIHADFGPLIDAKSASEAEARLERMLSKEGHVLCARALRPDGLGPAYFAPAIVECRQENLALEEIFAPILQTTRFKQGEELRLMDPAAQGGYGLTFGIQTRKPKAAEEWALKFPAGNIYVNRPIIGATVVSQPFGGEGLSGTGPKIGGSRYVEAFCHERALSNNSAAFGGCVDLLGDGETSLHRFFK